MQYLERRPHPEDLHLASNRKMKRHFSIKNHHLSGSNRKIIAVFNRKSLFFRGNSIPALPAESHCLRIFNRKSSTRRFYRRFYSCPIIILLLFDLPQSLHFSHPMQSMIRLTKSIIFNTTFIIFNTNSII